MPGPYPGPVQLAPLYVGPGASIFPALSSADIQPRTRTTRLRAAWSRCKSRDPEHSKLTAAQRSQLYTIPWRTSGERNPWILSERQRSWPCCPSTEDPTWWTVADMQGAEDHLLPSCPGSTSFSAFLSGSPPSSLSPPSLFCGMLFWVSAPWLLLSCTNEHHFWLGPLPTRAFLLTMCLCSFILAMSTAWGQVSYSPWNHKDSPEWLWWAQRRVLSTREWHGAANPQGWDPDLKCAVVLGVLCWGPQGQYASPGYETQPSRSTSESHPQVPQITLKALTS